MLEIGPREDDFSDHVGVGVEQSLAVGAEDGGVHDEDPTAAGGLQHVVEVNVGLQILDQGAPHRDRIIRVDGGAAKVRRVVFRGVGKLPGKLLGSLVRVAEAKPQNLRDIEIGECGHHQRHHKGDGQDNDGFSAQHKNGRALDTNRLRRLADRSLFFSRRSIHGGGTAVFL